VRHLRIELGGSFVHSSDALSIVEFDEILCAEVYLYPSQHKSQAAHRQPAIRDWRIARTWLIGELAK
jgi:hypothetical protein